MLKISGSNSIAAAPSSPRRAAGAGFSLAEPGGASAPAETSASLGISGVDSVDALIALQEVDGPLGRRRRAVKRAGRLLDELEALKISLLDGGVPESGLRRLAAAVREQRDATSDPALEALLDQIEARAAVELAKLETALKAA